jgi:hypothetical protein
LTVVKADHLRLRIKSKKKNTLYRQGVYKHTLDLFAKIEQAI